MLEVRPIPLRFLAEEADRAGRLLLHPYCERAVKEAALQLKQAPRWTRQCTGVRDVQGEDTHAGAHRTRHCASSAGEDTRAVAHRSVSESGCFKQSPHSAVERDGWVRFSPETEQKAPLLHSGSMPSRSACGALPC